MNWDDLRVFLAVARAQSVSGAGKELGMHHTNVARRMSRFEGELKTRLFDRSKTGYTMTAAGEQLFGMALRKEEQAQSIERSMMGLDVSLTGTVKLTSHQDLLDVLITPRLHEFHAQYPGIRLDLLTSSRLLNLDAREADIAVRLTNKPAEHLVGRRISPLAIGLYTSSTYRPRPGEPVKVILLPRQLEVPEWARRSFSEAVATVRVDSLRTAREALRQGLGVANLPCFFADADPELRRLDLPAELSETSVWLLNHVDLRATARVRACREWLTRVLSEQRDLLTGARSRWLEPEPTPQASPRAPTRQASPTTPPSRGP